MTLFHVMRPDTGIRAQPVQRYAVVLDHIPRPQRPQPSAYAVIPCYGYAVAVSPPRLGYFGRMHLLLNFDINLHAASPLAI